MFTESDTEAINRAAEYVAGEMAWHVRRVELHLPGGFDAPWIVCLFMAEEGDTELNIWRNTGDIYPRATGGAIEAQDPLIPVPPHG